jgi:hypothetical protein
MKTLEHPAYIWIAAQHFGVNCFYLAVAAVESVYRAVRLSRRVLFSVGIAEARHKPISLSSRNADCEPGGTAEPKL